MVFLDTNIVIWSYQGLTELISEKAFSFIENNDLYVSPMVRLELEYLYEIKRAKVKPDTVLSSLYKSIGLSIHDLSFTGLIDQGLKLKWTRDPFDRLITAHAQKLDATLLTKDHNILKHYKKAVF